MREPPDGHKLTVKVTLDVPMIYYRASGTMRAGMRAGWYAEDRLSALGSAVEEAAIEAAQHKTRVDSHFAAVCKVLGGGEDE